jgi:two-component system chemotaxis response regulator CheY
MADAEILVVEDEDHLSQLLTDLLEFKGYQNVQVANNGHEGVEKYKKNRPSVVFMDLEMPVMNGFDSSREIKRFDPNANIVVITADPWSTSAKRILKEGYASRVIPKPFHFEEILEAIK